MKIRSRWIIFDKWKIFLVKNIKNDFYCLPGWKVEEWEMMKQWFEREIFEELWVRPEVWQLVHIQEFIYKEQTNLEFWYLITNPEDFKNIDLSKTSHSFEIGNCGFYDLDEVDFDYKPLELKEILEKVKKWEFLKS